MGSVLIQTGGGGGINAINGLFSGAKPYDIKAEDLHECRLVGDYAFYQDTNLKTIEIPVGAFKIGDYAFYNCTSLTDVYIPATVITIGRYAFYGCSNLQTIHFGGLQSSWNDIDKDITWDSGAGNYVVVFSEATSGLTFNYVGGGYEVSSSGNDPEVIIIPDEYNGSPVTEIAYNGFRSTPAHYVVIPPTINTINNGAFSYGNLKSVSIPNSYTGGISVGSYFGSNNLECVAIGNGATSVYADRPLRILYIGSGVSNISITATTDSNFHLFISEDSQTYTSDSNNYLFSKNKDRLYWVPSGVTELLIPSETSVIDVLNRTNLESIEVDPLNQTFESDGGILYSKGKTKLVRIPYAMTIYSDFRVPSTVTELVEYACSHCSIHRIFMPEGLTTIGASAFWGASSGSRSLRIPSTVRYIGDSAFANFKGVWDILIPANVISVGHNAFGDSGGRGLDSVTITLPSGTQESELMKWWEVDFFNEASNPLTRANYLYSRIGYAINQITQWLNLYNTTITTCKKYTFSGWNGTAIKIPPATTLIQTGFLRNCSNLTDIYYDNTMADWNNITKESGWDYNTGNYTVHCSDGDIPKS